MRDCTRDSYTSYAGYAIAAAAPGDGGGDVLHCTHGQLLGVGYMLDGFEQTEPNMLIRDDGGRMYNSNLDQWRAWIATMQLASLEASLRIKGTPVAQLFAMAADLLEWFPAGGTEITSQAMRYLHVDLPRF
jgi:hypothetical protein